MKSTLRVIFLVVFAVFAVLFIFYVSLPIPPYPSNPPDSLQSDERGDTEDFKNRRAYFTDLTRAEVLSHHQKELSSTAWNGLNVPLPTYRLNYPPEDAFIFIKNQTRSVFLEEIVHPFRESFFINGFVAQVPKDAIVINGREFYQKITVRYYRSDLLIRLSLAVASLLLLFIITWEWKRTLTDPEN